MENTKERKFSSESALAFVMRNKAVLLLVVLCIAAAFLSDRFLTSRNLINVTRQICVSALLSMGLTCVLTSGSMDLSVGFLMSFVGVAMTQISLIDGMPVGVAILLGILLGAFCGFLNGFISMFFNLNPFIVTLAMQNVFKGASYLLSGNTPVTGISESFRWIGQGYVGFVPVPVIITVIAAIFLYVLLNRTAFGRYLTAIGGNMEAARVSGINVKKIKTLVYMLMGIMASVAAAVTTARVASAQPAAGEGMEMEAICASVLGGTSLAGGNGRIAGAVVGCLIVGVINNILNLTGIDSNWKIVVKGLLILFAILLDFYTTVFDAKRNRRAAAMQK